MREGEGTEVGVGREGAMMTMTIGPQSVDTSRDHGRETGIARGRGGIGIDLTNDRGRGRGTGDDDPGHAVGIEGLMKILLGDEGMIVIDHIVEKGIAGGEEAEVDLAPRTRGGGTVMSDEITS